MRTTMKKFIGWFSLAGIIVPLLFTGIWVLLEKTPQTYLSAGNKLEPLQLIVWPSSIFMMGTAGHEGIDYKMLALSVAVNVAFYALIGFLIWWGLNKQRWVLYVTAGAIAIGWYKLLTL